MACRHPLIYFLVLVFLNAAVFEDFKSESTLGCASYHPVSLADDFSYNTKLLPIRPRHLIPSVHINFTRWNVNLFHSFENLRFHTVVSQKVIELGGTIFFNEITFSRSSLEVVLSHTTAIGAAVFDSIIVLCNNLIRFSSYDDK